MFRAAKMPVSHLLAAVLTGYAGGRSRDLGGLPCFILSLRTATEVPQRLRLKHSASDHDRGPVPRAIVPLSLALVAVGIASAEAQVSERLKALSGRTSGSVACSCEHRPKPSGHRESQIVPGRLTFAKNASHSGVRPSQGLSGGDSRSRRIPARDPTQACPVGESRSCPRLD